MERLKEWPQKFTLIIWFILERLNRKVFIQSRRQLIFLILTEILVWTETTRDPQGKPESQSDWSG